MDAYIISTSARSALVVLAMLSLATTLACGSDLAPVQCTSNAQCASDRCEGGICVSTDHDTATDADATDAGVDVDASDDVVDAGPSDTGTELDVNDDGGVTDVADASDAMDAPDALDTADAFDDSDAIYASDVLDAADAFDAPDLSDVPVDPELVPPSDLSAGDGTSPTSVSLTWEPVEGADGYRVYRDGGGIADVDGPPYEDDGASRGVPDEVTGVTASGDHPNAVVVSWAAARTTGVGETHVYTVATLREDAVSEPSTEDPGFTAASTVAGYDLDIGGDIVSLGSTMYSDDTAPAPTVTVDGLSANWDGSAVQLSAVGARANAGAVRGYRVRARSDAGAAGPWSTTVTGRRDVDTIAYRWERSAADGDGSYALLTSTTGGSASDPEGPPAGESRYYRVTIDADGAEPATSAGVRVSRPDDPLPDAPRDVQASDGTSDEHVTITWSAVPGATSYDVYRDDSVVASAVTGTRWDDESAQPGAAPAAPSDVAASSDQTEFVRVSWNAAAQGTAGESHSYTVAARSDAGAGPRSTADTGHRAAPGISGYQVSIDSGAWQDAGTAAARSWDDADAPAGTVSGGVAVASDGTSSTHVALSLSGASAEPGDARSYRVRAVTSDGLDGTVSRSAVGRRAPGTLTYQWQRTSGDSDSSTWSNLDGATSATHDDTSAPVNGAGRYYRCELNASGAVSAMSTSDRGYRALSPLGAPCSAGTTCDSGFCGNGRCAPEGFSYVAPGTFTMGSPDTEVGRGSDETQHSVTLTRSFFLQQTEVTQAQWRSLMGNNPSNFDGCDECPVEMVNWYEALAYANALSDAEGLDRCYVLEGCANAPGDNLLCGSASVTAADGNPLLCTGYRLPTEAEWEYAARAGTATATYLGDLQEPAGCDPQPNLEPIAYYCENNGGGLRSVANLAPNSWQLYDMLGNVMEWCWDWYGTYPDAATDPLGDDSSSSRVLRGGSWASRAEDVRAAFRNDATPNLRGINGGFRLARTR